jgi:hypothetical protein
MPKEKGPCKTGITSLEEVPKKYAEEQSKKREYTDYCISSWLGEVALQFSFKYSEHKNRK